MRAEACPVRANLRLAYARDELVIISIRFTSRMCER